MGKANWVLGEDHIPFEISGHANVKNNHHGHAFFLPEDKSGYGRIDHVLIHAPVGFGQDTLLILKDLARIRNGQGQHWRVLLEGSGVRGDFSGNSSLCSCAREWISVTPYLHPWFGKKKFTLQDQVLRECRERNLPQPGEIEILPEISVGRSRTRRCVHFYRFRSKPGLTQPDTQGRFLRLVFPEPLQEPLALGFGRHFWPGLFGPEIASAIDY